MRGANSTCRLQKNTPTTTGTGSSDAWEDVQSFRGTLIQVSQSEQKIADKDSSFDAYTLHISKSDIQLGNRDEVKTENRIVIGARYYDIIGVGFQNIRGGKWTLRLKDITDQTEN